MYEVIHYFTDLQDNRYPYNVGDIFPRGGLTVSNERLKELSGNNNRQHKPLIKLAEEEIPFYENNIELNRNPLDKKYTRSEIQRMNKAELQEVARKTGVDGVDEMTGTELKEYLLNVFGL